MAEADREKWDQRYAEGSYRARTYPSPFLVERLAELPRGRALDLACGAGRNALCLAEAGYAVEAVDISGVAVERARATARERGLDVDWGLRTWTTSRRRPAATTLSPSSATPTGR